MPKPPISLLITIHAIVLPLSCFSQTDVLTWHNDNLRTGQNLSETILTPANVKSATFGKLFNLAVDGKVDAQPLYAAAVAKSGGGTRNVLFVVTEHDSVYAFDADAGTPFWPTVSLLKAGETPSDARGCNQVTPEIGITGTPVIDRGAGPHGTIYVVAMSKDSNGKYHHRLHALDITTGGEQFGGPVDIQATYPGTGDGSTGGTVTFDPGQYKARPGLLLLNGVVYTSWSSHCDIRPYTGWVIGYNELTLSQTSVLNFAPNGNEAAIWMAGAGPAADASGNIYISMANGTFDTTLTAQGFPSKGDYGNAFVKVGLSAGKLAVLDYWTMDNTTAESNADTDLGSGGILLLPDVVDSLGATRHLGVGAGKDRNLYIVDRDNMGKFTAANNNNIYQELPLALGGGEFATPAWFNGSVYVGSVGDSIRQFKLTLGKFAASPASTTSHSFPYPGTTPSISANGTSNPILWAAENTNPAVLHAYDANDLATELYNSNQAAGNRDQFGAGNKFITTTIANGKVFVGTTNSVGVFGLLVQAQSQTITFSALANKVLGSQPFPVSASASSGLPVSFASLTSSVCTVSGSTVTLAAVGQCTIQASQAGNSSYSAAPNVNQSFQVTAASAPTVSVTAPTANATISGKSVQLTATASAASGLSITSVQFKVDGQAIPGGMSTTSPYQATLDSTTLSDGGHSITAVATDSSNNSSPSAPVQVKVSNAPVNTEFITAATFGAARNNFSGWLGMQFTVGPQNVTVVSLGRIFIPGNTGTHIVKLVNPNNGSDIPGGSVSINMSGGTPNKFTYANLPSPLVLTANTSYNLVSQESYFGDQWYDVSQVAGTSVATINGAINNTFGSYGLTPNTAYVPVSFLYGNGSSGGSAPPSVSVTSPSAGPVSGSVTFSASATAASGLQITNLQLKLDGNNYGSPNTVPSSTSSVSATLNTANLASGGHTLTAVATDSANSMAASAPVVINVSNSTVPPSVSITSPAAGSVSGTITIAAQVTAGSNPVSKVQFQLNGANIGPADTSAPYSTTLDTTTLTNGTTYQLTAIATDTQNNSAPSSQVAITVSNSGQGSGSPLITAQSPGAPHNYTSTGLGMQFTVGANALTVTSLGRMCIAGNSGTHIVKLATAAGSDLTGGAVSVSMAGCTPGTYKYQAFSAPVVLAANTTYLLISQETYGGDQWYDIGPVTSTPAVTVDGAAYFGGFYYYLFGSPGTAYVPLNLLYK